MHKDSSPENIQTSKTNKQTKQQKEKTEFRFYLSVYRELRGSFRHKTKKHTEACVSPN